MIKSKEHTITVAQTERRSDFDYACQEAQRQVTRIFEIDDCGYTNLGDDFPRNCISVVLEFVGYKQVSSMGGFKRVYTFKTWVESVIDEDD